MGLAWWGSGRPKIVQPFDSWDENEIPNFRARNSPDTSPMRALGIWNSTKVIRDSEWGEELFDHKPKKALKSLHGRKSWTQDCDTSHQHPVNQNLFNCAAGRPNLQTKTSTRKFLLSLKRSYKTMMERRSSENSQYFNGGSGGRRDV